jgi:hypothetical protein
MVVPVNQAFPGMKDGLRPDLLIVNELLRTAEIIDVATPFGNRYAAFEAVRKEKRAKYDHIADRYDNKDMMSWLTPSSSAHWTGGTPPTSG